MRARLHWCLWLVSIALVGFQLALMQILSIVQWHHFAGMTISVALLGFGCSGTVLALGRSWLLRRIEFLLPMLFCLCALFISLSVPLTQGLFGGFDVYMLVVDSRQFWLLLLCQLLFLLPMFCGALAIGLIFVSEVQNISSLYFANLLGSACGGLLLLPAMWLVAPATLPSICALFALMAGLLLVKRASHLSLLLAVLTSGVITVLLVSPPTLQLSQYKGVSQALTLPGARIEIERFSPWGLLQVLSAPSLRPAPDLSLGFRGSVPAQAVVFNNGEQLGPLPGSATSRLLDFTPGALPYHMAPRKQVLVLQAGNALGVAHALQQGADKLIAVEPNRDLARLAEQSVEPFGASEWHILEPRAFLAANRQNFDLIMLPDVGSFGGNAGIGAMAQQYLLTTEAMASMWHSLTEEGVILITAWLDSPPRNSLRLAETLISMLRSEQVEHPAMHLVAIRNWGSITFLLKRSPLTAADIAAVRAFCTALQFDPTLLPGLSSQERIRHHQLEDKTWLENLDTIVSGDSRELLADYPFRLQATTDDRPFFSQFLRWQNLPELGGLVHQRSLPLLELGYVVELVTFVQLTLAALILILLPLGTLDSGGKTSTLVYFGALGLGYMFFEIALLHQLIFYFGQPVFAAAGAISILLLFSGLGSYFSGHGRMATLRPRQATLLIALLLATLAFVLPVALSHTISLEMPARVTICLLLLALPSTLMGFPFPTGLRSLAQSSRQQVPWAWGINGCLSVIATPLAAIVAVEAGFYRLMLLAALAYATAAVAARR